jgi:hypothetical protein
MSEEIVTPKNKWEDRWGNWKERARRWLSSRTLTFWGYFIVFFCLLIARFLRITHDFVKANYSFFLTILCLAILFLIVVTLSELIPKPKGLVESLKDVRRDEFIDATLRRLENEPPRTWSEVAWCIQQAMSIVAQRRRSVPRKRIIQFAVRISIILLLLTLIVEVLVISSENGKFGLVATSSFGDFAYTSILAIVTFGRGVLHPGDFDNSNETVMFLTGIAILSVLIMGLGLTLLVSRLDESSFMSYTYRAVRTHFEYSTKSPDQVPRLNDRF